LLPSCLLLPGPTHHWQVQLAHCLSLAPLLLLLLCVAAVAVEAQRQQQALV
jgi:hypothetical protein